MEHINIARISLVWISPLANQRLNHKKVAKKRGKMHGSKTIITFALCVNPLLQKPFIKLVVIVWIILKLPPIAIFQYVFTKYLDSFC